MAKLTPSKRKQLDYSAESRRNTERIQQFCRALVDAFGYKAVKAKQRPIVYWLDSKGHLNHLRVLYKLKPDSGFENVPWIVRIYMNHFAVQIPQSSLLELLGMDYFNRRDDYPTARTRGRLSQAPKEWSFELSLFPSQLKKAIPWIVQFAHNKDEGVFDEKVLPPFKCRWWMGYDDHCNYAWSEDAHIAYEEWNAPRIRERERIEARNAARRQAETGEATS